MRSVLFLAFILCQYLIHVSHTTSLLNIGENEMRSKVKNLGHNTLEKCFQAGVKRMEEKMYTENLFINKTDTAPRSGISMTSMQQHSLLLKPRGIAFTHRWLGEFPTMFIQELVTVIKKILFGQQNVNRVILERLILKTFKPFFDKRVDDMWQRATSRCDFTDKIYCKKAKDILYRSADGSCNNLRRPILGRAMTPFNRILPAQYEDGIGAIRTTSRVTGAPLPSARKVSSFVHKSNRDTQDRRISHFVMQWGQFLDHDITLTPTIQGEDPNTREQVPINCCKNDRLVLDRPTCAPISIPAQDPFFRRRCMDFVRSVATPKLDCKFGKREQINQLTSFIDGSQIYGSSLEEQERLRAEKDGLLKTETVTFRGSSSASRNKWTRSFRDQLTVWSSRGQNTGSTRGHNTGSTQQEFLPAQSPLEGGCVIARNVLPNGPFCPLAGDERQNEQGALTSMHTLWLREHNRIARKLKRINSNWSDQQLFDVTRKIVSAMLQHITYNEDLPIVLGPKVIRQFSLGVKRFGFFQGYNDNVDPRMTSAFSTAAYRFGHTLIRDKVLRRNMQTTRAGFQQKSVKLRFAFNNPTLLFRNNGPDSVIAGLTGAAQKSDHLMSQEVTDRLFEPRGMPKQGLDLAALNIQRGRDHGLPSYNKFRRSCNLPVARTFRQMLRNPARFNIPVGVVRNLMQVYRKVDDIELFTAGLSETPFKDAHNQVISVVGPTFACIIGKQFRKLKFGDRFYYENPLEGNTRGKARQGFTTAELREIRKTTLSGIVCRNTDITQMPRRAFLIPQRRNNPRIHCSTIQRQTTLNLSVFKYRS